jgi:glycerol-3-phosphate dehydrogenase (NAD+)
MRQAPRGPQLISQLISTSLNVDCSVLMGANVAEQIGREELSEATIGFNNFENAKLLQKLFQRPYFLVNTIPDVVRDILILILTSVNARNRTSC